jgi:hypothetical protein
VSGKKACACQLLEHVIQQQNEETSSVSRVHLRVQIHKEAKNIGLLTGCLESNIVTKS